jgi:hypothetical protein
MLRKRIGRSRRKKAVQYNLAIGSKRVIKINFLTAENTNLRQTINKNTCAETMFY